MSTYFEHIGKYQEPRIEYIDAGEWSFEKVPTVEVHPANGCEEVEYIIESARRAAFAADQGDEATGAGA